MSHERKLLLTKLTSGAILVAALAAGAWSCNAHPASAALGPPWGKRQAIRWPIPGQSLGNTNSSKQKRYLYRAAGNGFGVDLISINAFSEVLVYLGKAGHPALSLDSVP